MITSTTSAHNRRGAVALLAMLYLVLLSTMAVGFYAATTLSAQVSDNEQRAARAQLAAESGMEYMRLLLLRVNITSGNSITPQSWEVLVTALATQLGDPGLYVSLRSPPDTGAYPSQLFFPHNATSLTPALMTDGNTIGLDGSTPGARFAASLSISTDNLLVVDVVGYYSVKSNTPPTISRHIRMTYSAIGRGIFDYSIAARGQIQMKKGRVVANPSNTLRLLSALPSGTALDLDAGVFGDASGGRLAVISNKDQASLDGTTVHGSSSSSDIRANYLDVVSPPLFPTVDTAIFLNCGITFRNYSLGPPFKNVKITKGTNATFNGGEINGIIYVESGSTVTFRGGAKLNGILVFENKVDPVNSISFSGNSSQGPIPTGPDFDMIPMTGHYILAPSVPVTLWGNLTSACNGSIICSKFDIGGSAKCVFNQGNLITLSQASGVTTEFEANNGSDSLVFNGKNTNIPTSGITYPNQYFVPTANTYREVSP